VLKDTEARMCAPLSEDERFRLDLIACPAIHCPHLTENGELNEDDEHLLRVKLRLIFQAARKNGNDSLVLGAMGCGAWKNPPHHVATIMKQEIDAIDGMFSDVVVACLQVDPGTYILRHHDREAAGGASNFDVFSEVFFADHEE